MKLRGLRSCNLICITFFCTAIFLLLLFICVVFVINQIITYNHFIRTFQFSTVPFWQDNRTNQSKTLSSIKKIDDVNLTTSTIVIAACCRNVQKSLPGLQKNVEKIVKLFSTYRIYFCESDSSDKTLEILNEWKRNDSEHVRVISKGHQRFSFISRTNRIATCRNTLLDEARRELPHFDYYLVIDVDIGSSSSFDIKDFLSNFIYPSSSWIAMTATQKAEYYDIWALRVPVIISYDCWLLIDQLTSFFLDQTFLIKHLIKIHQKPIPRTNPLIEVQSAFGGAAIYAGKYLHRNCSYNGWNQHRTIWNDQQCEHVSFHQCLLKYANEQRIYINPQFQIC